MTSELKANELLFLSAAYPEKTFYLGQVFNDTTNSYKLFWLLALLQLLKGRETETVSTKDVVAEMAVAAWHPVCLFRLSLGHQDKLQNQVSEISSRSKLPPNAEPEEVRGWINNSAETQRRLESFRRYVPTRFLRPWFADKLRGTKDSLIDSQIRDLARASQTTHVPSLYWFDRGASGESLKLNASWRSFLFGNLAIVQSFVEHNLALYLQARNPHVPGVVNKLNAPANRQLVAARRFWDFVRERFAHEGRAADFKDIYSNRPLHETFAIDHFLPWSFVTHDLLWNLAPVEPSTNSSKSDTLPDLELYVPRLAKLHFGAIQAAKTRSRFLEDYTTCFKLDTPNLISATEYDLTVRLREVIAPQAQIAMNLGFEAGWTLAPQTAAELKGENLAETQTSPAILPFPEGEKKYNLPYYSLKVAAGAFIAGDAPEPEGWINLGGNQLAQRISQGMFVTRVTGKSMEPTIRDGAWCIFRAPVVGSRQGRVLLVQKRAITDPETGGNFTVKRYRSTKRSDEETGWQHELIELVPDNTDRKEYPILRFTPEDDDDLRVIAEFVTSLAPPDFRETKV